MRAKEVEYPKRQSIAALTLAGTKDASPRQYDILFLYTGAIHSITHLDSLLVNHD